MITLNTTEMNGKDIEEAILREMNGLDVCTVRIAGKTVLIKYQGNDQFYSKREQNWYMRQPEKLRNWKVAYTLTELAQWIKKYC